MRKSTRVIGICVSIPLLLVLTQGVFSAGGQSNAPVASNLPSAHESYEIEVLAVNEKLKPVTDMKPEDFQLSLDKSHAMVESAGSAATESLNFLLLFDFSRSRARDRDFKKELMAAGDFLRQVWRSGDTASIVAFADFPHTLIASTKSLDSVTQGIEYLTRLNPNGSTSLYDAICSVSGDHSLATTERNIFLIFSDFNDDSSRHTSEQGLDCVADGMGRNAIYSLDFKGDESDERATRQGIRIATTFSAQTGGVGCAVDSASGLATCLSQVSASIRATYLIRFELPIAPKAKKLISIEIKSPRKGIKLYFPHQFKPK